MSRRSPSPKGSGPAFTEEQRREVVDLFDQHCDGWPAGLDDSNYAPCVQDFFERFGAEYDRPLMERAVLDTLASWHINGARTEQGVRRLSEAILGPLRIDQPDVGDMVQARLIPGEVYPHLPGPLARCCSFYRSDFERDVFLTGALAHLAAAVPSCRFRYGHRWQGTNVYVCVVAKSGYGKGVLADTAALTRKIDEDLLNESEAAIETWEEAQKDEARKKDVPRECPIWKRLVFAGDSSDAEIVLGLHANQGQGLLFETEITTIQATMGREWAGGFRAKLLSAWPNEEIKQQRKGLRPLRIVFPSLSLAVSGTEEVFADWIRDMEDGLFNRTAFYTFRGSDEFENQWHDERDLRLDKALEDAAGLLSSIFRALRRRVGDGGERIPLFIRFSEQQKARQLETFAQQKRSMLASRRPLVRQMAPYTHRVAVMALRHAANLTVLRRADEGADLSSANLRSIEVTDTDYAIGTQLALTYLAHGIVLAQRLPERRSFLREPDNPTSRTVFAALSVFKERDFTRAEAQEKVQAAAPLKERAIDKYLAALVDGGFLEKVTAGVYRRGLMAPLDVEPGEVEAAAGPITVPGYAAPSLIGLPAGTLQVAEPPPLPEPPPAAPDAEAPF